MLCHLTSSDAAARRPQIARFARSIIASALIGFMVSGACFAQGTSPRLPPPAPAPVTPPAPAPVVPPDVDPVDRSALLQSVDGEVAPLFMPALVRGNQLVRVVVILAGDSVANARAKASGHKISLAESNSIETSVAIQQAAITPLLQSRGARVLAQFANALNGIKVEVPRYRIPELVALPGVESVRPVGVYKIENVRSVPFIGAPLVWQGIPGFRGEGIKVAIVDTGIDYTHANFGGPGTVAAWNAAFATSTLPANPAYFGPSAPKVKGGTDLVGDAYNANDPANNTPHPDPNPLDCNGHGSHVAGTAAGFGVLNNATYTGPYNSGAYSQNFGIGPGVAPKADVYAVRVFGCTGST
ncbi:MAG: hypothetical protein E6H66_04685, partial [Betaproteobacteria bacterium]